MKRNFIVLGCAGLLAFGLSLSSFAGSAPDADGDGVPDAYDNCTNKDNGPLQQTGACFTQEDADVDGYGQPCDFDYNNDGGVAADDLGAFLVNLGGTAQVYDSNCDGGVAADDLGAFLQNLGGVPGPSGLACAGTPPCFAQ